MARKSAEKREGSWKPETDLKHSLRCEDTLSLKVQTGCPGRLEHGLQEETENNILI